MALFRGESPVLGTNTAIEIPNGGTGPSNQAKLPPVITVSLPGLAATSANAVLWTAPPAPNANGVLAFGQYALAGVSVRYGTASSAGTLMIEKTPSGTAVGSGTNLLSAAINIAQTANTPYTGTLSFNPGLNVNLLNGGDSLSLLLGGTLTSLAAGTVTLLIQRVV